MLEQEMTMRSANPLKENTELKNTGQEVAEKKSGFEDEKQKEEEEQASFDYGKLHPKIRMFIGVEQNELSKKINRFEQN